MPVKIYRRGDIWHYRGTAAGRRLRGSTGTSDKARAQRIAAEAESKAWDYRLDGPEEHVTFAQAAIAYRESGKPDRFLEKVEDHWKDTPLKAITPKMIQLSARKIYPRAAGATWNRQVIVPTQAIINFAHGLGWCGAIKVKRFPVVAEKKTPATKQWVEAFANHASPHLGALCLFMFGTAARISEAINLTWADVDLGKRRATLRGNKPTPWEREAHLPPPVLAAIANIPSSRRPEDRVFGYAGRGSVKDPWRVAIKAAGIEELTAHCCRHGFATTMLRAGYDAKTVAKLGGWKDAATLLRTYAHALEDATLSDAVFGTNLTQAAVAKSASN